MLSELEGDVVVSRSVKGGSVNRALIRKAAATIGAYGGIALLALAVGPLLLLGLQVAPLDWSKLSDIGQSYSGLSALLSAGALLAVAYGIRLQQRQLQISHTVATFEAQQQLLLAALGDMELVGVVTERPHPRRHVYNTLWLRYFYIAYTIGELDADQLIVALRYERFATTDGREHWLRVQDQWRRVYESGAAGLKRTRPSFVQIASEAFDCAVKDAEYLLNAHEEDAEHKGSARSSENRDSR